MVPISLIKADKFDLTKSSAIDLAKSGGIDLSKSPAMDLVKKAPGGKTPFDFTLPPVTGPVPGLVPIPGTDLWVTPLEPVSPDNCALYPDSLLCGGLPFSFKPIGVDVELAIDECNIGISLTPIFGFIKLPPIQVVYRKDTPECSYKPPDPPVAIEDSEVFIPCPFPSKRGCYYEVIVEGTRPAEPEYYQSHQGPPYSLPYYLPERKIREVTFGWGKIFGLTKKTFVVDNLYNPHHNPPRFSRIEMSGEFLASLNHFSFRGGQPPTVESRQAAIYLSRPISSLDRDRIATSADSKIVSIKELYCIPNYDSTASFLPPLPPPMPACCPVPDYSGLLKALLIRVSELDAKVEACNNAIGVEEFPANLPKRLIYPNAKGNEKLENLVQVLGYQVKQIDKAVGYLPQKIKVLDTNSAMAGNQSVEVEIHSFADFAKETLQYLIDTEGDDDTLANIAVRILYECGAIHQLSVQIAAMVDAAIEYLDFKEGWKTVEVPFSYDPYAGQKGKKAGEGFGSSTKDPLPLTEEELEKLMPDLLKETLVKIKVLINTQKRTLSDLMQELLRDTRLAAAGVSENASVKRLVEIIESAQAALQLQNAIARNNVRKALTSGDLRTRKKPK